jgi:hypothetical protein
MGHTNVESMTPHLLLSLWRERWGKTAEAGFRRPYLIGKPNTPCKRLVKPRCQSAFWLRSLVIVDDYLRFSLGGKSRFSVHRFSVSTAFQGTLIALTWFCSFSCSVFLWRFCSMLGHGFNVDFY